MYLLNEYNSLEQLSRLLWQLNTDFQGETVRMFGVRKTLIEPYGIMHVESDFVVRFTQDKTAQIRTLILAMDNTIDVNTLDNTINHLIAVGEMEFGDILTLMNVTTRDMQYLIDNGFISETI